MPTARSFVSWPAWTNFTPRPEPRSPETPVHDMIDPQAERARLQKQKQDLEQAKNGVERKLANENFVTKAKPEVVAQARQRLQQLQEQLQAVETHLAELDD